MRITKQSGEETVIEVSETKRTEGQSAKLVVLGLIEEASRIVTKLVERIRDLWRRAYRFVRSRLSQTEDVMA